MFADMPQWNDVGRALVPDDGTAGRTLQRQKLCGSSPTIYILASWLAPVIHLSSGNEEFRAVLVLLDVLRLSQAILHYALYDALLREKSRPHHALNHVEPLLYHSSGGIERAELNR